MITDGEKQWLSHMMRWGSDGYPVSKSGKGWIWREAFGVGGSPIIYKTKKAAMAACALCEDLLIAKKAGRL
jgi:hypothetical protein